MKERFDKTLHKKLYDLETDRPVPSWAEMQRRMTLSENASGVRPRRPRKLWAYAAAAALIAVMMGIGIYQLGLQQKEVVADLPSAISDPEIPDFNLSETPVDPEHFSFDELTPSPSKGASALSQLMKSAVSVTAVTPSQLDPLLQTAPIEPSLLEGFNISPLESQSIQLTELPTLPAETAREIARQSGTSANMQPMAASNYGHGFDWDRFTEDQQRRPWLLSAYTGTYAASKGAREAHGNFVYPNLSAMLFEDVYSPLPAFKGEELDHRFPISVGITARKHITRRWALETGLVYSYLEATGEKTDGFYLDQYRQQVHYLGIPLYASYSLFNNNRWDIYLNGGFMAEVALAGNTRTRYFNPSKELMDTDYGNLGAKGVLWSTSMGAGVNYYMLDNFGIYLEPGASYYFANPNQPYTYRTKHPWSFNVRLGFRVKF